jgi:dihydroorotate dehydrogenase (fumarate)
VAFFISPHDASVHEEGPSQEVRRRPDGFWARIRTPLVVSASPLSESLDNIKRMEDAGASAVVLYSLFEEQIRYERYELHWSMSQGTESYPEALSYFPEPGEFSVGPEEYVRYIEKAKAAVNIPIIASLNGSTPSGWTSFARHIQQAGADALELNLYNIPTDVNVTGAEIEQQYIEVLRDAAIRGRGVALIPTFIAGEALDRGTLRAVLQDYQAPQLALYAIYPPTRHLSVKVRLFIDFLVERFSLDAT